ncbi:histidyl tRNA synthetase [Candidatus Terasakiella magnetica]|uniref:Histidine--tRNA ligase n=1 Tax=Candidatus Terasakiella magnetica TaxID=1867952 RepID=A0A1C3RFN4_9PROT|nr:histidine--tRNA ligase [Candidatus Terasakiella magnetica]SCA56065.1 histidyl tRNA synthetase [Candidatus Terasakiella magnetica]
MAALKSVKGTYDLLPKDRATHRHVTETARLVCERYGFNEVTTPIFEFSEVFSRTLGETSDVVTKEMFSFETKGGDKITLRPEGTAGICRSFISNGLQQQTPVKHYYYGPMFRYERPQKGRQRQFHQVGIELIGVETPQADVEVIAAGYQFLQELGMADDVVLELNSLGDSESRVAYRDKLVEYFTQFEDKLSEDSKNRLQTNPLRILDSKDEGDKEIVKDAPVLTDSLNESSLEFFNTVKKGLDLLGIPYMENPRLVRGLDYYCHTAFEFTTTTLGAQGTVLAGGRYDNLIKMMGGPQVPGVGWASGVERLALMAGEDSVELPRPICIIPISAAQQDEALKVAHLLRSNGYIVDQGYSGNMKKRLNRANKANAVAALLLGEDELARGAVTVRDLESGEQNEVSLDGLVEHLAKFKA